MGALHGLANREYPLVAYGVEARGTLVDSRHGSDRGSMSTAAPLVLVGIAITVTRPGRSRP